MAKGTLRWLRAQGFDQARSVPFTAQFHVGCSQCQALAINGVATHETGCPNQVHTCKGCDALVPYRGMYCEDCS